MIDYRKMYHILCAAASDALDVLPESEENMPGRELLRKGLLRAEELYIQTADDEESENGAK